MGPILGGLLVVVGVAAAPTCEGVVGLEDVASMHSTLRRDGFVIVDAGRPTDDWEALAASLPSRIFGSTLLSEPMVAGVHIEHKGLEYIGDPLLAHTDGYIYGDHQPDYILLLAEAQSETGGESIVVDGEKVFAHFDNLDLLRTTQVDLQEKSPPAHFNGRPARGPLYRRVHDDRLWWRRQVTEHAQRSAALEDATVAANRHPYQSIWVPFSQNDTSLLEDLDVAVQLETRAAPRVKLQSGQAIVIDNYRTLHGRERYAGSTERRLWRIWVWTNASLGIPIDTPQIATTLDADRLLEDF